MCFFRRKKKAKAIESPKREESIQQEAPKPIVEQKVVEPIAEQPKIVESKPVVKAEEKVVEKKEAAKKLTEEEIALQEDQNDGDDKEGSTSAKVVKIPKYHVSQNKDEDSEHFKKWRVRKEGSTKTIKFFDTQKDAIVFAQQLAESAGSSVVIHKVDGSIRKQDYTKKP